MDDFENNTQIEQLNICYIVIYVAVIDLSQYLDFVVLFNQECRETGGINRSMESYWNILRGYNISTLVLKILGHPS